MDLLNILTLITQRETKGCFYYWEIYETDRPLKHRSTLYAREAIVNFMFDLSLQGKHVELMSYDCDFNKKDIKFQLRIVDGIDIQTPDIANAVSQLP